MIHQHSFQVGKNVSLVPKRAVFRETPSEEYQRVVERQYQESALASIRLEFDRVLQSGSMNQQQVNDIFQPREEHIRQVFGDDPAMADNRDRILQQLGTLKSQVLAELARLGEVTTAGREAILQRTSARYQEFITFLQGRGVISQVSRVETPPLGPAAGPVPTPSPTPRPAPSSSTTLGPRPAGPERVPETRNIGLEFHDLSRSWGDVNTIFSDGFYRALSEQLPRDRFERFVTEGLRRPNDFHQLFLQFYQDFNRYLAQQGRPRGRRAQDFLPPFFAQFNFASADRRSLTPEMRRLMESFELRAGLEPQLQSLSSRVESLPLAPAYEQRQIADRIGNIRYEAASEQQIAPFVRTAEAFFTAEFPQGIRWEALRDAYVTPGAVHIAGQRYQLNIETVPVSGGGVSEQVTVISPRAYQIDLAALVTNLQQLRRDFGRQLPSQFSGRMDLRTTLLALARENQREGTGREVYRELLRSSGIRPRDLDSPDRLRQTLARFGLERVPNESRSAAEWTQALLTARLRPQVSQADHRLLFVLKFLAKTREVSSDTPLTLQQYTQRLLESTAFRPVVDPETLEVNRHRMMEYILYVMGQQPLDIAQVAPSMRENIDFRSEAEHALDYAPGFQEIIDFFRTADGRLYETDGRPVTDLHLFTSDWNVIRPLLEQALVNADFAPEGQQNIPIHSAQTVDGGRVQSFRRETLARYRQLRASNPYFRMITSISNAPGHSLQSLSSYFLMPLPTPPATS